MWKYGMPIPLNWLLRVAPTLVMVFGRQMMLWAFFNVLKLALIPIALYRYLYLLVFVVITFQPGVHFALPSFTAILVPVLQFVCSYPLVLIYPWASPFFLSLAIGYYLTFSLCEDLSVLRSCQNARYWMQFHWVPLGPNTRMPGHVAIYDTHKGVRLEGTFVNKVGPRKAFTNHSTAAGRYAPEHAFEIPISVDPLLLPGDEEVGEYSPTFNCQTFIWKLVGFKNFILLVPLIIASMMGFTLIGLWFLGYYSRIVYFESVLPLAADAKTGKVIDDIVAHVPRHVQDKAVDVLRDVLSYLTSGFESVWSNTPHLRERLFEDLTAYLPDGRMPMLASSPGDRGDTLDEMSVPTPAAVVGNDPASQIELTNSMANTIMGQIEESSRMQENFLNLSKGVPQGEVDDIAGWVQRKMADLPDNLSLDGIHEAIGFLLTIFKDSPRAIVKQLSAKYTASSQTEVVELQKFVDEGGELLPDLTDEEVEQSMLLAIHAYLTEKRSVDFTDFPIVPDTNPIPRDHPDSDRRTLISKILDKMRSLLNPLYKVFPQLADLLNWLTNLLLRQSTQLANAFKVLEKIGEILWDYSFAMWRDFLTFVSAIVDTIFNEEYTQRIKAVWAATTLVKAPSLALRARLEADIAYMSPTKRGDPVKDFANFTQGLEETYYQVHGKRPALLAVLAPPGSGKTTFANANPSDTLDIDTVIDQSDKELVRARSENDFTKVNELYKAALTEYLPGLHSSGKIVLAHSVNQLPDCFYTVGLMVQDFVVPESEVQRVKMAQLARQSFPNQHFDRYWECVTPLDAQGLMKKFLSDYRTGGILFNGLNRPIRYDTPMMTDEEANLLGFKPGDYETDPSFQDRVNWYREQGVKQGGDGVFFTLTHPDKNRETYDRYAPQEALVSREEDALNWEVAAALTAQFPEAFENARLTPPQALKYYLEAKMAYSPGNPFLNLYKKRKELYAAGWDEVLIQNVYNAFKSGKYPNSFYHGFIKSQVVDAEKLAAGKDPRSVVAQDLASYYIDQVIQLERNKRITWRSTGVGIGMILNQNMQGLFESLENFKNTGGYYFEADAIQFDSRNRPGNFDALAKLSYFGFLHRGEDVAERMQSVMSSNYTQMQDAYIMGITENKWIGLTLGVPTKEDIRRLTSLYPERFVAFGAHMLEGGYDFTALGGKVILTTSEKKSPSKLTHPYFAHLSFEVPETFRRPILEINKDPSSERGLDNTVNRIADNIDKIYNLHFKNRGGGTGQSATSWDNTWGFRISFIKGWMRYHNFTKTAADFFKENVLYNTGDDSMWVIKLRKKDYDYDRLVGCMAQYGVDLTLEVINDIEEIQYLGQRVYRTRTHPFEKAFYNDWVRIKRSQTKAPLPPQPRFLVYHDQSQTLMRRSAFQYYKAGLKGRRYIHASIQRSSGQAQLTAWNPSLYKLMAREYIQDLKALASYYRQDGLDVELRKQTTGAFGTTKNPWWEVSIKNAPSRQELERLRQLIISRKRGEKVALTRTEEQKYQFWAFIRDNKFPTFYRVVSISMKLREEDPSKYDKFFEKFFTNPTYVDQRAREWIDLLSNISHALPREWHRMQPTLSVIFPDPTFYTPGQLIEKFLYTSNGGDKLSLSEFQDLVAQSPYGALCHSEIFWHNLSKESYVKEMEAHPPYVYKNLVMMITLTYMLLYPFEIWITRQPFLGIFWRLFILVMIDIPKFYSIFNLIFWHDKGRSSTVISALIPRDPYIQMKRFAGIIMSMAPIELGYVLRFDLILPFLSELLPRTADLLRKNQQYKELPQDSTARGENPWDLIVATDEDFKAQFAIQDKAMIITAPTGTGKSTMLQPALDQSTFATRGGLTLPGGERINRHIILFPRQILRDEWSSPLVNTNSLDNRMQSTVVTRRLRNLGQQLVRNHEVLLMTYGHFINRPELWSDDVRRNTVYHFDEFHEQSDELKVAFSKVDNSKAEKPLGKVLFLSATPAPVPWAPSTHFDAPLHQRFKKRLYIRDFRPSKIMDQYLWAREQFPEHAAPSNTIIRVNYIHEVTAVIQGLMEFGIACQEVSRRTRAEPIDKSKLLVCTQIIDAGINLPGRRLLIETGMEHKSIEGQQYYEPSSSNTAKQLMGRVGRFQNDDIVIRPPCAGTGRDAKAYGSPELFTFPVVADSHQAQLLVPAPDETLHSGRGRDSYIHVNKRSPLFTPAIAENVLLLLSIEQTIVDLTTLERDYHACLRAKEKMDLAIAVAPPEALEHVYLRLPKMELDLSAKFEAVNEFRQTYGNVLYSIKYDPTRPTPEAAPYSIKSDRQIEWSSIKTNKVAYFSVRSLAIKGGTWIEREDRKLERVVPEIADTKRQLRDALLTHHESLTAMLTGRYPDLAAQLSLQHDEAVRQIKATISSPKTTLIYRGSVFDPAEHAQVIPAAVTVLAIQCPQCYVARPHTHDSTEVNLENFRHSFIKFHDVQDRFVVYYDNPFIGDTNPSKEPKPAGAGKAPGVEERTRPPRQHHPAKTHAPALREKGRVSVKAPGEQTLISKPPT